MKNNNTLLIGLAIAGFFIYSGSQQKASGAVGSTSGYKEKLIKKYLWQLGLPEGSPKLEAKWRLMSDQEILNDAYKHGILLESRNAFILQDLIKKYLWQLGMPEGSAKLEAKWKKMELQEIVADANNHGVNLL
ncbi:MAG: hypothetical protein ABI402_02980 [Ferruginibacter sp.]